ncbi:MAG: alpha/beta fold hydrolase [Bacillota bacterium]|nr:alpha/beta fold hydrolase [Bacillota bacterium]
MLVSKAGYEIPYVYEGKGNEKKIVIICHGFGSSKESPTAVTMAEKLNDAGIGAVRFDFPSHGESKADSSFFRIENCMDDLASVEQMIADRYPDAEILYFSSSFGGFINLLYISERPHRGRKSFLRCAAADMPGIVRGWLTEEDKKKMFEDGYLVLDEDYDRPLKVVKEFAEDLEKIDLFRDFRPDGTELLMIHGTEDETAPYADALRFSEKFGIELISVEGADHRFTPEGAMDRVRSCAVDFFKGINII